MKILNYIIIFVLLFLNIGFSLTKANENLNKNKIIKNVILTRNTLKKDKSLFKYIGKVDKLVKKIEKKEKSLKKLDARIKKLKIKLNQKNNTERNKKLIAILNYIESKIEINLFNLDENLVNKKLKEYSNELEIKFDGKNKISWNEIDNAFSYSVILDGFSFKNLKICDTSLNNCKIKDSIPFGRYYVKVKVYDVDKNIIKTEIKTILFNVPDMNIKIIYDSEKRIIYWNEYIGEEIMSNDIKSLSTSGFYVYIKGKNVDKRIKTNNRHFYLEELESGEYTIRIVRDYQLQGLTNEGEILINHQKNTTNNILDIKYDGNGTFTWSKIGGVKKYTIKVIESNGDSFEKSQKTTSYTLFKPWTDEGKLQIFIKAYDDNDLLIGKGEMEINYKK